MLGSFVLPAAREDDGHDLEQEELGLEDVDGALAGRLQLLLQPNKIK